MTLSVTYGDFAPNTTIVSSQMDQNFDDIETWANGNIGQDNFATLTGAVNWSVSSNVFAINISNSGTEGSLTISQSGVLASGKSALKIASASNQTSGAGLVDVALSASGATIPVVKLANAGTGSGLDLAQSGVLASGKAGVSASVSGVQINGKGAVFAELTNASSTIPLFKGENTGSGPLLRLGTASTDLFEVNSSGSIVKAAEPPSGNFLINSDFDFWQRGTSATCPNGGGEYCADRWYVRNTFGATSTITYSRQTDAPAPGIYCAEVKITSAPGTPSNANGCELWQTLENFDSRKLYDKTASFGVYVKGVGNITQVGIQFFYNTSETVAGTAIGSEVLTTVSSGAWTLCKIDGQALGTDMTTSGVIAVRIRITGASSGNIYALNNGFRVARAMLNIGSRVGDFTTRGRTAAEELMLCQRFYEKTYAPATVPGTATVVGCAAIVRGDGSNALAIRYQVQKRTVGSPVAYSTNTGANNVVYDPTGTTDRAANLNNGTVDGFQADPSSATVGRTYLFHWIANSEIG